MKVVFFQRKPRPDYNFSVENLFHEVRKELPPLIQQKVKILSFFSNGFFKRVYISLEAMFSQGDINHVTGDINFIAIFLKRKKTVLTILDLGFMDQRVGVSRFLLKLFWITLPSKRAEVITTISIATKNELLRYVNVPPSKIKVVYVPLISGFFKNSKSFNKDKPVILQIGTKDNKNVFRLAKALKGLKCHLCIIGDISIELLLELRNNTIEYSSFKNLSNQEVYEKYVAADVVSFVSTVEGFGMPIVEANAVGRVVVTSNISSMPEVAGNAAHLVDPFDIESIRSGVERVIEDDLYRDQLISNGFENTKRFNATTIARRYAEIYDSLLANRKIS
ncbi:MAG: glycosyltransferase family 4 protein [Bacteroidetes bacterium]|nr:glycosyltransferase family 4 protein [Bacteroidota bacterium]